MTYQPYAEPREKLLSDAAGTVHPITVIGSISDEKGRCYTVFSYADGAVSAARTEHCFGETFQLMLTNAEAEAIQKILEVNGFSGIRRPTFSCAEKGEYIWIGFGRPFGNRPQTE